MIDGSRERLETAPVLKEYIYNTTHIQAAYEREIYLGSDGSDATNGVLASFQEGDLHSESVAHGTKGSEEGMSHVGGDSFSVGGSLYAIDDDVTVCCLGVE